MVKVEDVKKIYKKLDSIEAEIDNLKLSLAGAIQTKPKKVVSLKGLLKGLKVGDKDIEEAKKSLFKHARA